MRQRQKQAERDGAPAERIPHRFKWPLARQCPGILHDAHS
jgi:hypothetical protein